MRAVVTAGRDFSDRIYATVCWQRMEVLAIDNFITGASGNLSI